MNGRDGDGDGIAPTTTAKGPVDCRALASMYYDEANGLDNETRVWCPELDKWKKIIEIPNLINAFEAIDVPRANASFQLNQNTLIESLPSTQNYHDDDESKAKEDESESALEDFFTSTNNSGEEEEESGNVYSTQQQTNAEIKDAWTNASSRKRKTSLNSTAIQAPQKKKIKKPKFKAKNAKNWVYVQGLPTDTNEQEVANFFAKVGILDLDPETQNPKVKLYRYRQGEQKPDGKPASQGGVKGDATICYARPESVDLALQILDSAVFRDVDSSGKFIKQGNRISVQRAKFEQHGSEYKKRTKVSDVKRKVARIAKLQAVGWDEGNNGFITGGLKGLRIIVIKHAFDTIKFKRAGKSGEDLFLKGVETQIKQTCEEFGIVEKITIFSGRSDGIVIVKFTQPTAASAALEEYNGKTVEGRTMEAKFWDGVTDYTKHDLETETKEAEKRHEDFGDWLDEQELPEEFQLKVEGF